MRQIALVLVASLAAASSAHAQAWPNAAPSPYGNAPANPGASAAPQAAPPAATNGAELGSPPHALGAATPNMPAANPAPAQAVSGTPAIADVDNPQGGRATAALNVLEAQGYADFGDFRSDGSMFTALVNDGGQQFRVVINPDTGQLSRQ